MRTNSIKLLFVIFIVAILAITCIGRYNSVRANDRGGNKNQEVNLNNNNENSNEQDNKSTPTFSINPQGKVTIHGAKLTSNSGQSLMVTSFGLNLTVSVSTSTNLLGEAANTDLSAMKTGDILDIKGTIDNNSGIIAASSITDKSLQQQNIQNIQQQIQSLLDQIHKLQQQLEAMGK